MRPIGRPLRFVGIVLATWAGARVLVLLPGPPPVSQKAPAPPRPAPGLPTPVQTRVDETIAALPAPPPRPRPTAPAPPPTPPPTPTLTPAPASSPAERLLLADLLLPHSRTAPPPGPGFAAAATADPTRPAPGASRWSGDAYLFLRDGGGRALGPGGQVGGGQAFARLAYRIDPAGRIAATARLSRAVGARQGEAALGLALAPVARAPVRLTIERRVALDRGGRDAWAAFLAGGIDAAKVGPLRLDGYAQAGIVGARRGDAFVDGAARLGGEAGRATLGVGLWGAAQPGAARLDVGPQAALRLPLGPAGATLALDWRIRLAGRARPGSGLALTLAAGF